ncbi:MAG: SCO family protein [Candidatus Dechloromonas phosphoritropha]
MLRDHNGRNRSIGDFRDKVIVIFFGYTSCPDICPTTLARLAEVMKELGSEAERVQVLFVSLDPERDTKERLKEFVPWFHPSFLGLHGDAAQTKAVSEEFRVFSSRKEVGIRQASRISPATYGSCSPGSEPAGKVDDVRPQR